MKILQCLLIISGLLFLSNGAIYTMEVEVSGPLSFKEKYPHIYNPLVLLNIAAGGYCAYQAGAGLYSGKMPILLEESLWSGIHLKTAYTIAKGEKKEAENISLINIIGSVRGFYRVPASCCKMNAVSLAKSISIIALRLTNKLYLGYSFDDSECDSDTEEDYP